MDLRHYIPLFVALIVGGGAALDGFSTGLTCNQVELEADITNETLEIKNTGSSGAKVVVEKGMNAISAEESEYYIPSGAGKSLELPKGFGARFYPKNCMGDMKSVKNDIDYPNWTNSP